MTTETKPGAALVERAQEFIDNHDGEVKGGFGLHLEFAGWVDGGGAYSSEELHKALKHAKKVKESDPHEGPWTESDEYSVLGDYLEYALRYGFELGYAFSKQDTKQAPSDPFSSLMFRDGVIEGFMACAQYMRHSFDNISTTTCKGEFKLMSKFTDEEFDAWFVDQAKMYIDGNRPPKAKTRMKKNRLPSYYDGVCDGTKAAMDLLRKIGKETGIDVMAWADRLEPLTLPNPPYSKGGPKQSEKSAGN